MDETPMKVMEELAGYFNSRIRTCIDIDYNVVVYITDLDRLYKKKYLSNLDGRGLTYEDACIDYIRNLMNKKYNIRYKKEIYATEPLRRIIRNKCNESIINYRKENEENAITIK